MAAAGLDTAHESERNRETMAHVTKIEAQPRPSQHKGQPGAKQASAGAADERAIVRLAQKGDKAAFETLVQRHQHRVFAVARGILKRQEDVEDVAQQVFVKAYFSLTRFDQRAAFSTWLYKITVNECWDMLRKRKVRPLVYEADLSEEQARQVISSAETGKDQPDISDRSEEHTSELQSRLHLVCRL